METKEPEDGLMSGEAVKEIIHDVAQESYKRRAHPKPALFPLLASVEETSLVSLCPTYLLCIFVCRRVDWSFP